MLRIVRPRAGLVAHSIGFGECSLACAPRLMRSQRELNTLLAAASEPVAAAATAAAVAKPLVGPMAVSFLSVSPAIAGQILFLSPMQAMRQFRESGTTGAVSVMPYAAMAANGAAWTIYGALSSDYTIMVPNFSGLLFGAYYCSTFYAHRAPDATVVPYFGGGAAFVAAVVGAAATLPVASAQTFIGSAGCALTALMFYGPLASLGTVMRDKSAASLPLAFTLASTANCTLWTSYGLLVIHDPFVYGPNGFGLGMSMVQLGLIARFGTEPPPPPATTLSETEAAPDPPKVP